MKLKVMLGIPLVLVIVLLSVLVMTLWWQIFFSRILEYYLPAKFYEIEQEERLALALKGTVALDKSLWLEATTTCFRPICIETPQKKYHLRQSALEKLEAEKQNQRRIFFSESLFLMFVLLTATSYLIFLIHREKKHLQEREHFLAMATHELKHPISTLFLLLESLKLKSLPAEQQEKFIEKGLIELQNLKKQSENLLKVQQLSLLSKPEKYPYPLLPLLEELIKQCEQRRNQLGRCQLLTSQEQTAVTTTVNRQGLELILSNLIDNALVYSSDVVTIKLTTNKKALRIDICDRGLGFTKQEKNNLGKMFFRSPRHEIQNIRGSGLGLFTVMRLISLMKLKLTLHSEGASKGSCFSLLLKK